MLYQQCVFLTGASKAAFLDGCRAHVRAAVLASSLPPPAYPPGDIKSYSSTPPSRRFATSRSSTARHPARRASAQRSLPQNRYTVDRQGVELCSQAGKFSSTATEVLAGEWRVRPQVTHRKNVHGSGGLKTFAGVRRQTHMKSSIQADQGTTGCIRVLTTDPGRSLHLNPPLQMSATQPMAFNGDSPIENPLHTVTLSSTDHSVSGEPPSNQATPSSPPQPTSSSDKRAGCSSNSTPNRDQSPHLLKSNTPEESDAEEYRQSDEERDTGDEHGSQRENEWDESDAEAQEEHIPLSYQIPEDLLRTAMEASPNTRAAYWTQRLYRGPHDEHLSTHYCRTLEVAERVAKYFVDEKVLGFDIEWKPFAFPNSIKENASLIQLASEDRIALFHIALYPGKTADQIVPPTLKTILESPNIYKVGVAVKADFTRLRNYLGIQARGVFELSRLYNLVEHHATDPSRVNFTLVSLARQVQRHLLLPLYKGEPLKDAEEKVENVRESDWSRALSWEQIQYAAADAYAGFRLFDVLESKRKKMKPTPPLPRLCDQDPPRDDRPKSKNSKAKAPKPKADTVEAAGVVWDDAEVASIEEDTQEYQTAAEDAASSDEAEESESEFESDSAYHDDDSDAKYVARGVGRIALSRVQDTNPAYPKLPIMPSEESDLESNVLSAEVETGSEDEFADAELEEALMAMEIDESPGISASTQTNTGNLAAPLDLQEAPSKTETLYVNTGSSCPTTALQRYRVRETPQPAPPPAPAASESHGPEYTLATTWATSYLHASIPSLNSTQPSRIHATVPHLRAYHLWHEQSLPLEDIGAYLRDPPLAQSTVSGYILQAVSLERLAFKEEALKSVLESVPRGVRLARWRGLCRKVGAE